MIGDSSGNKIYNNTVMNAESGLTIKKATTNNTVYDNKIIDVKSKGTDSSSTTKTITDQ